MRRRVVFQIVSLSLCLGLLLSACNLPERNAQPTSSEPTPNMTMTALFNIVTKAPGVSTPVVAASPTAQVISPTLSQPISTPPPIATATPIPLVTNTPQATAELRPAGKATAAFLSTAPKLDGVWDEWNTDVYGDYPMGNW